MDRVCWSEAILSDVTEDNYREMLAILADAYEDEGNEERAKAVRWALSHRKYPLKVTGYSIVNGHFTSLRDGGVVYAWHRDSGASVHYHMPITFHQVLISDVTGQTTIGRYYYTFRNVWRAFLQTADNHVAKLGE